MFRHPGITFSLVHLLVYVSSIFPSRSMPYCHPFAQSRQSRRQPHSISLRPQNSRIFSCDGTGQMRSGSSQLSKPCGPKCSPRSQSPHTSQPQQRKLLGNGTSSTGCWSNCGARTQSFRRSYTPVVRKQSHPVCYLNLPEEAARRANSTSY